MFKQPAGPAIIAVSLLVALGAIFWTDEYVPKELMPSSCPLGYGGANILLPYEHPPVEGVLQRNKSSQAQLTCFFNGQFWTANPQAPVADALLVDTAGIILAVGSLEHVYELSPPGAQVTAVDLKGQFTMPGIVDSHVHFISGGLALAGPQGLQQATSRTEFVEVVRRAAAALAPGEWVTGATWDEATFGGQLPNRSWLDEAAPYHPVFLRRMDIHMGVASTLALRLANVTAATADPMGGLIDRDVHGQPTGMLREHAQRLVMAAIPEPSLQQRRHALTLASQRALSKGVTTVVDLGRGPFASSGEATWEDLEQVYEPAAQQGELRVRISAFVPLETWPRLRAKLSAVGSRMHAGGRLSIGGVKEFADGSLGSRTALMWAPYQDAQDNSTGTRMVELARLQELVQGADAAGLQITIHAIGDRAIDEVVAVLQQAVDRNGDTAWPGGRRHRVEHTQHISGAATAIAMAKGGFYAIGNPLHLLPDAPLARRRLGAERAGAGRTFAFKTLLDAGVPLAHGSDWPVADVDGLGSVYTAVHRCAPGRPNGTVWHPEERLLAEAALRGHTTDAAHAAFLDGLVGMLKPGLRADFIVLDSSPLKTSTEQLPPTVMHTYVDGRCVFGC